jgi:two-component system, OmpR family, phosphate regulon response regulator PhoB
LLQVLLEAKGRVLSRDALLEQAWPHTSIHGLDTRTVDVHIRRLRKALNGEGEQDLIRTVRSAGYSLDLNGDPA